jgi:hypothetical protein
MTPIPISVRPSNRDRLLWLAGATALALLFAQTWTRAHRPGGIDLTTYLEAARAVQRGESPYALPVPFPYIYPPFLAFALIPLAALPADVSLSIWFAASVAAIVWAVRAMLTEASPEHAEKTPFLAALFVATFPIVQSNLRNGQVNFIVIALAAGAFVARHAAGRAVCWALGIAIKLVPGVLAPFFVRRGEWRVCGLAAAALAALLLLPAATFGAQIIPLTREYVTAFLGGSFGGPSTASPLDFSLGGMLALALGTDGWWLRLLGAVLPVAAAFAVDLRTRSGTRADAYAFALYLAIIPLASPKSEVHHLAFALPAAALAFGAVWVRIDRSASLMAWLSVALATYAAALTIRPWSGACWFTSLSALVGGLCLLITRTGGQEIKRTS